MVMLVNLIVWLKITVIGYVFCVAGYAFNCCHNSEIDNIDDTIIPSVIDLIS